MTTTFVFSPFPSPSQPKEEKEPKKPYIEESETCHGWLAFCVTSWLPVLCYSFQPDDSSHCLNRLPCTRPSSSPSCAECEDPADLAVLVVVVVMAVANVRLVIVALVPRSGKYAGLVVVPVSILGVAMVTR